MLKLVMGVRKEARTWTKLPWWHEMLLLELRATTGVTTLIPRNRKWLSSLLSSSQLSLISCLLLAESKRRSVGKAISETPFQCHRTEHRRMDLKLRDNRQNHHDLDTLSTHYQCLFQIATHVCPPYLDASLCCATWTFFQWLYLV